MGTTTIMLGAVTGMVVTAGDLKVTSNTAKHASVLTVPNKLKILVSMRPRLKASAVSQSGLETKTATMKTITLAAPGTAVTAVAPLIAINFAKHANAWTARRRQSN